MKLKKINWFLGLILLVSFFIRIYKIDNLSLFGDEIDVGYQAFSLLQTGHDYKGNLLPVYIQSLAESRAPLLIYTSVPSIAVFGLNELGVRFSSVIFGILSIYLLYKLVFFLSKSEKLALLTSSVLSLTPWHFHYSRVAFEVTLLLSLVLLGVYYSYKYIDQNKKYFLYLAIVFYSLSFYTYNTANIFVPLIIIFIFLTNIKFFILNIKIKNILISFLIFIVVTLPLIHQILFGSAANRFQLISIFNNQNLIDQIINKRTTFSANNPNIEAIFHNKPIYWTKEFTKNYFSSLSLPFLFISGDQLNLRHTIPGFGLLFTIYFPFLIYGLFSKLSLDKFSKLMLFWLLISPIAASLTFNGGNHATRLFLMIIPLAYFISIGLVKLFNNKKLIYLLIKYVFLILLLFEIIGYHHEYFGHYPKDSFESWNFGYKELFTDISKLDYNRLFISNSKYNSLLPYLFYNQVAPISVKLDDHEKQNIVQDLPGFKISESIFFINNWKQNNDIYQKIDNFSSQNDIFVLFQLNEIPGDMDLSKYPLTNYQSIKTIYNPDGSIIAQIIKKL